MNRVNKAYLMLLANQGSVAPLTVTIASTESSPSAALPIPVTITFLRAVTGFAVGDITAAGCTLSDFAGSGTTYTVNITPVTTSMTLDIAAGVCQDAGGVTNQAATQFAITSSLTFKYVRTTGNDTTGDGSTGNAWLTISKALATVAAGNVVVVGSGTYVENTSSYGYFNPSQAFASDVIIESESGVASDVVIKGTSGTTATQFDSAGSHFHFRDVTFASTAATTTTVIRLARVTDLTFTRCAIVIDGTTGARTGVNIATSNGTQSIARIKFDTCTWSQTGAQTCKGIASAGFNTIDDVQLLNCTVLVGWGTNLTVGTNIVITGGNYAGVGGAGVIVGADADSSTLTVTATITGATISSASAHGLIVGTGVTSCTITGCTIAGGDYGVVIKECSGVTFGSLAGPNTITSGTSAALYFKAANGCTATRNIINNSNGDGVYVLKNASNNHTCGTLTLTYNTITTAGAKKTFNWGDATNDTGGCVCDYNTYHPNGTAKLGIVRGDADVQNLTELQAAWVDYDVTTNDANSTVS